MFCTPSSTWRSSALEGKKPVVSTLLFLIAVPFTLSVLFA